jgi:hypothetical protein
LRDLTEASSSVDTSEDGTSSIQPSASDLPSSSNKFIVSKCNIEEFKTCLLCVLVSAFSIKSCYLFVFIFFRNVKLNTQFPKEILFNISAAIIA